MTGKKSRAMKERHAERSPEETLSRNLSYILRHGAAKQGLTMRNDGFVKVSDLLAMPKFNSVDFVTLERVVQENDKKRYTLICEPGSEADSVWWIRANQGHSIENVEIHMNPITHTSQIPMAVHGTTKKAWERIAIEGLSRMGRQHVHFAQGLAGSAGVVSGMRSSSQILIYLNVPLALETGLKLMLSANEVVLCPGDEHGMINPRFFGRVEWAGNRQALPGWEGHRTAISETTTDHDIVINPV